MFNQKVNAHGGDLHCASKIYGRKKSEFLDYSANINPLGLPEDLRELLKTNIDDILNYPDPDCMDLKAEISQYLHVENDSIIIGNGASEIIFLLFDVLRPEKVLIPAPCFSEYSHAASSFGIEVKYFELKEEESFKLDIKSLVKHISDDINMVFLCNPNNPTSHLISKEELRYLLDFAKANGVAVVIDEAFIELTLGANTNSMVNDLRNYENLFLIRAFTKLFAIPGLRLGYGVGNPELIKKMWTRKMPWSVNSFACGIGSVLSDKTDYLKRTALWLQEELNWFYNELIQLESFKVFKPSTNFILMKILEEKLDSGKLKGLMAAKGILIRDASNFNFLNERFVRVAIKDRENNIKFLKTIKEIINKE
jgi:threonine-phosphate decarboxylase